MGNLSFGIISENIGSTACKGKPHHTVPGVDREVLRNNAGWCES